MARWAKVLETLDRRIVFIFIFLAVLLPLFFPVGLPITPSPPAIGFYERIESVPEGATVYLAADFDPGSMPELYPILKATMRHLCRKKVKIIVGSLWPACPPLVNAAFTEIAVGENHLTDGVDFVNLGYKEGREVVMVQLGDDIHAVYPTDHAGRAVGDIPIMKGVHRLQDVPLLISISAGYPGTKEWVQQVRSRWSLPIVSACTAVSAPEYYPYLQSNQIYGLLGGLAGAAEYEVLVDLGGAARKQMDAQSLGHVTILFFIVLGNLVYFVRRREDARGR